MTTTPPTGQQLADIPRDLANARVGLMMFRQALGSAMGQISETIQQIGRGTAPLCQAQSQGAKYRARWESTVREAKRQHAEVARLRAELATTQAALAKACTCWADDQFMHLPDCHGNHITWNDQTWHAAAAYTDRDGGVWWLVATDRAGEPEFRPETGDEDYSAPLSEVLAEFGPLALTPQGEIPQPF